jgi:hypothetical protein
LPTACCWGKTSDKDNRSLWKELLQLNNQRVRPFRENVRKGGLAKTMAGLTRTQFLPVHRAERFSEVDCADKKRQLPAGNLPRGLAVKVKEALVH